MNQHKTLIELDLRPGDIIYEHTADHLMTFVIRENAHSYVFVKDERIVKFDSSTLCILFKRFDPLSRNPGGSLGLQAGDMILWNDVDNPGVGVIVKLHYNSATMFYKERFTNIWLHDVIAVLARFNACF